tara:strand:+ start:363 stop:656 length:294 start_codon:yes stop_codon:yes gene_type:complete
MKRGEKINTLQDILKKISNKPKFKIKLDGVEALNQLNSILGKNLQSYIVNKYFKNGIIYIYFSSSVLRSEISYQKQGLIDNINANIGAKIVKDIILK